MKAMSKIVETYEDGWDCVPELKRAIRTLTHFGHLQYEINNCVRAHELPHIVEEIKEKLEEALEILDTIDTDVTYKTVDYEEV